MSDSASRVDRDPNHLLLALARQLEDARERTFAAQCEVAARGERAARDAFLISNELWGGSGSIADQAGVRANMVQCRRIARALVDLGRWQLAHNVVNPRTEMWVQAYQAWLDEGLI